MVGAEHEHGCHSTHTPHSYTDSHIYHTHSQTHIHIYTHILTHMLTDTFTHIFTDTHSHKYAHITDTHMFSLTQTHIHTHTYTLTHIQTHTLIYMHTRMRTHMQEAQSSQSSKCGHQGRRGSGREQTSRIKAHTELCLQHMAEQALGKHYGELLGTRLEFLGPFQKDPPRASLKLGCCCTDLQRALLLLGLQMSQAKTNKALGDSLHSHPFLLPGDP